MRVFALAVLVLVLPATAGGRLAPASGALRGLVTRGPITPVCVAEAPCSEPAPNVTLVFLRNGRIAGRAVTDRGGVYRLRLPAGVYAVRRATATGLDHKLEPNSARVFANRRVRVDFAIDTGIR